MYNYFVETCTYVELLGVSKHLTSQDMNVVNNSIKPSTFKSSNHLFKFSSSSYMQKNMHSLSRFYE